MNDFDAFVESVLGGSTGLPKQASVAPVSAPAGLTAEQAEQIARAQLSEEEVVLAETLGRMEAENTVKQASFINSLGGQQMNYGQYLAELQAQQEKSAGVGATIHGVAQKIGAPIANLAHGNIVGKMENELAAAQELMALGTRDVPKKVAKKLQGIKGMNKTYQRSTNIAGYGVGGLGAVAALAGAGLGAKRIAAARRAAQAPVEQSIGRAVLQHLGRNKGKYAIGGAAALGLGGLMASKSASADELLWEKAASTGEAFLDQLASACLGDATTNELAMFRETAIEYSNNGKGQ